jgi:signal transduction histidine kinase
MAAGVAHDLNNVLTVIGGTIEDVLERHTDLGGARADLTSVMASIDSATGLLRRMVSFSHARPPLLELTDLDAWLLRLRDMLTRMLGPHIGFELRQTPTLQAMLVDRSQLESALLNLILNARDAMPKGGSIVVETESLIVPEGPVPSPLGLPGPYVAITVRDTGAGMPPAMAKRAFEPFFSSKPFGSGTGLGLVMVQQFARQAGGSVSLSSSPGVGTSIRIMLPTASV